MIAPSGPVYQAGTLSGNPLAMAAGIAQLLFIREHDPYEQLERTARRIIDGVGAAARDRNLPFWGDAAGGMFGWHFVDGPVHDFDHAATADTAFFSRFHQAALRNGVFLPASPFEACFLSIVHTEDIVDRAIEQLQTAVREAA